LFAGEPGGTVNGILSFPNGDVGIVVLEVDHNYKFLKRFAADVPASMMPERK
jgi:hypothetical protein